MLIGITVLVWCSVYGFRALQSHLGLRTNAYDLSVFDYALWSTGRIRLGYVPFLRQSLFSQHFMPTLLALWPAYQIVQTPIFLIIVQLVAFAVAAVFLYRLLPADLRTLPTLAILVAFLFGRRSHSAVTSVFYIESLEPLLIFMMLLAWRSGRRVLAACVGLVAMGCKEDMAIYIAAFGASVFFTRSKRTGAGIIAGSLLWLLLALVVVIPASRIHDSLTSGNPFVQASLGSPEGIERTTNRISLGGAATVIAVVTASAGFLCWFAPEWLLVAFPGLLVTLAANPHATASGISGHYWFPVLPWVFAAAAVGAGRLQRAYPTILRLMSVLMLVATIGDSPLWHRITGPSHDERAAVIRSSLQRIPADVPVLAMPNLVPHLSHRRRITTFGGAPPEEAPDWIVISSVGDLWPLDDERVREVIAHYATDSRFEAISSGPLYVFHRRQP